MSTKLKAYEVRDNYEGNCVIIFATNNATARREGAGELEIEWESVEHCRRAPYFDVYAPGPVPLAALVGAGWWIDCNHCGVRFDIDGRQYEEEGDRDDACEPVSDGNGNYCSPTCMMEHYAERRAKTARKVAAIEATVLRWPEATGIAAHEYSKAWPSNDTEVRAQFTLPGIRYPVTWAPGGPTVMVSNCDIDEFKRLYGVKDAA